MAADDLSNTSTNRLRALQYNEKVATLNKQFIKQLQKWMEQTPHYDFTDTVKSYIEHISHLSKLYSMNQTSVECSNSGRTIVKAKRRLNRDSIDPAGENGKTIPNISTPAVDPPRRSFAFGNVSEIFDSTATPTISAPTPATTRGKRAIRGGGLLGGEEKVIFKGSGGNSGEQEEATKYPTVNINLPKPTPGFWSKKDPSLAPSSTFSFGGPPKDTKKEEEKEEEDKESKKDKKEETKAAPLFAFGGFGAKPATETSSTSTEKKDEAPKLGFPSFGSQTTTSTSFPSFTPAPFTGFSFGSSATTTAPSAGGEKGGDDEEYVPPKVDIVEKEVPDSMFSTKCSVFKIVDGEYKKLGVGLMHLKDTDGKKSVLIRAATATGNVFVNAAMNTSMKVNSVPNDAKGEKLNLIYPLSEKEMGTFLVRFASKEISEKVKKIIEDNTK